MPPTGRQRKYALPALLIVMLALLAQEVLVPRSLLSAVRFACLLLLGLLPALPVGAASPPDPPVIESPRPADVSPADVHMEMAAPFHDPDGDSHAATDWEIRTEDGLTVVWAARSDRIRIHAHFSDGRFQGPLAGQDRLDFATPYLFRVRFRDSSGLWSAWSERRFTTAADFDTPARQVQAVLSQPAPVWQTDGGTPLLLPAGARLILETGAGAALLTLAPVDGGLTATPHPLLAEPARLRLRLSAPTAAELRLPSSRLVAVAVQGGQVERLIIFLPALVLAPGAEQVLWVTESGATFYGRPEQSSSDRRQLARDTVLPWALEPGYRLEAVAAAFQHPTSLAFVPNPGSEPAAPRFYVTELHGRVKVVTNDGRVFNFAEDLLNMQPRGFPGAGEQGITGICLGPASPDVYITLVHRAGSGSLRNQILRLRTHDGLTATGVDEILTARPGQGVSHESHQIQQCAFGPDGKLYVAVGDGASPPMAADDRTFNGKVLRLNPDGSAPADNPRYDPANPAAPISYQFTKRHRNPFGIAIRPSTGQVYLSENGPNVDRLVHAVPGGDYGWDGTDASMHTNAVYIWPEPHWAPVGLTFVEGPAAAALPAAKHGRLLVAATGPGYAAGRQRAGKAIQEFVLDADGRIVQEPTVFARYIGEGRATIVDPKLGPDGLYFTDLFLDDGEGGPEAPGGKVWRIRYAGQTSFTTSATSGPAPLAVAFADTSTLRDPAAWRWDFGDGTGSSEPSPSHTFSQPGRYAVSLTVTAADGTTSEALTLVTVTDPAGQVPDPAASVRLPAPPTPAAVFFPETGVGLGGGFKYYWEANGGLAQFGYPLTNEFREVNPTDGQEYTVQYFERARFEYHPEHAGTAYETQLGLLGRHLTAERADEPAFQPVAGPEAAAEPDALFFDATGHTLSGPFRRHWEATGGAAVYGLPISQPLPERWRATTPDYTVQYFERARLEYHPEAAGTVYEMRIGRVGTAVYVQRPSPRLP